MKTALLVLSTVWTCIRHSKTTVRYLLVVLYYVPTAISLIRKFIAVFGSEEMKEAFSALKDFLGKIAPPAPTADSIGTVPANQKREYRRRLFRFANRLNLFGAITDYEEHSLLLTHNIQPYTENQNYDMA